MKRARMILIVLTAAMTLSGVLQAAPHHHRHPHRRVRVHYELGGRDTVVTDGIHPAATCINGIPYFPYPGDGGTWIEYRDRHCYVYAGMLYVQVKGNDIRLRFRRLPLPSELAPQPPVEALAKSTQETK